MSGTSDLVDEAAADEVTSGSVDQSLSDSVTATPSLVGSTKLSGRLPCSGGLLSAFATAQNKKKTECTPTP